MKISELIKKLQKSLKENGDLKIYTFNKNNILSDVTVEVLENNLSNTNNEYYEEIPNNSNFILIYGQ